MNRKELLEALQTNRICDYIAEHYYESNTYELKELLLSVLYIGYDRCTSEADERIMLEMIQSELERRDFFAEE